MTSTSTAPKRPAAITAICVLGALGVAGIAYLFSTGRLEGPDWYMPYLVATAVVGLIAMFGMFQMRRWGVYLYAGMFAVNQVVLFSTGLWTAASIIAPVIVIGVAVMYLSDMR